MENILTREEMRAQVRRKYEYYFKRIEDSARDMQIGYFDMAWGMLELAENTGIITSEEYYALYDRLNILAYPMMPSFKGKSVEDYPFPKSLQPEPEEFHEIPEENILPMPFQPEEEEDTLPFPEVMGQEDSEEPEKLDQQDAMDEARDYIVENIIGDVVSKGYYRMSKPWDKEILQKVHEDLPECRIVVGQDTLYFVDDKAIVNMQDYLMQMIERAESEVFDCQLALKNLELHHKKYIGMLLETGQIYDFFNNEGNLEAYEALQEQLKNEEETCEAPETGKAGV